jgi:inner membrane protein
MGLGSRRAFTALIRIRFRCRCPARFVRLVECVRSADHASFSPGMVSYGRHLFNIVVIHTTAAIGVITGMWPYPQWISAGTWGLTFAYAAWRIVHHEVVVKRVKRRYRRWRAIHVLPGLWWFKWQYVVQTDSGFELGVVDGERLLPSRHLPFSVPHDCIDATRHLSVVRTLQDFAKREYVSWKAEPDGGYLVTWTDLRFWREKDWPYRAEVRLDGQFNVLDEQIGWYKKAWEAPYV